MANKNTTMSQPLVSSTALFVAVVVGLFAAAAVGAATIADKCSNDFGKVTTCLNYATGKEATPTKECCTSVTEIKGKDPVCLCYFIQQAHNGSEQVKSLGIQLSRLIQLPSACKLANASVSDCPKLLDIPPTSPDYAIFTNSSATAPTTTPSTPTGTTTPTTASNSSGAYRGCRELAPLVAIAIAVFLMICLFPVEAVSTFPT